MHLSVGQTSLLDLLSQIERGEIVINRTYQREAGIWPLSARSYFIDTILEGYPFPRIYLYQNFSETSRRPYKELVDGQQRVTTIQDFYADKFALNSASKRFSGLRFSDLDEEDQNRFIGYQIDHSLILSAPRSELLEMFRRMNAYTAPLKEAEKRHAKYQGEFKWFVNEMSEMYSDILGSLGVLTDKQIARMGDSEFISDLIVTLNKGILTKKSTQIEALYKDYDASFDLRGEYSQVLFSFFGVLNDIQADIQGTFLTKSYVVHSLFCAFAAIIHGYPGSGEITNHVEFRLPLDLNLAVPRLLILAEHHELQDDEGVYGEYVRACLSSTTQQAQRVIRTKWLIRALTGNDWVE